MYKLIDHLEDNKVVCFFSLLKKMITYLQPNANNVRNIKNMLGYVYKTTVDSEIKEPDSPLKTYM